MVLRLGLWLNIFAKFWRQLNLTILQYFSVSTSAVKVGTDMRRIPKFQIPKYYNIKE